MKIKYYVTKQQLEIAKNLEDKILTFPNIIFASVTIQFSETGEPIYTIILGCKRFSSIQEALRIYVDQYIKQNFQAIKFNLKIYEGQIKF